MTYHNFWSFWDNPILYFGAACILTVLIETVFFRLFGFKSRLDLRIIALTNVFTNEALNLFLHFEPGAFDTFWLIILELLVVAGEYLIYRRAFGPSRRLLVLTFFANVLSFFIGALVYNIF